MKRDHLETDVIVQSWKMTLGLVGGAQTTATLHLCECAQRDRAIEELQDQIGSLARALLRDDPRAARAATRVPHAPDAHARVRGEK